MMSMNGGWKPLRILGKIVALAMIAAPLLAAAPAGQVISEVKADFDGDGRPDRAAIETTATGWRLVAVRAGKTTVLENEPGPPDGFYVKAAKPGMHGGKRVKLIPFEFGKEESGSQIIYWTGKTWARIQEGD